MGKEGTILVSSSLHFEIERRLSTKSHVDTVPAPVIQERHEERTFRDLNSVYFREPDAPTDPIRVLDENRVSRGSIFHRSLVLVPTAFGMQGSTDKIAPRSRRPSRLSTPARCSQPAEPVYQVQPPRPTCGAVEQMSAHTT